MAPKQDQTLPVKREASVDTFQDDERSDSYGSSYADTEVDLRRCSLRSDDLYRDNRRPNLSDSYSSIGVESVFGSPSIDPVDEENSVSSAHADKEEDEEQEMIREQYDALTRSKAVGRVKIIVFSMLICATIIVTILIFHFTKTDELDDYDDQFDTFSTKIIESMSHNMDMKFWTAATFASVFTSRFSPIESTTHHDDAPQNHNGTCQTYPFWPYVNMEDFREQTKGTILLAHAQSVYFAPLITNETLTRWLDYGSRVHSDTIEDHNGSHHDENIFRNKSGMFSVDPDTGERVQRANGEKYYFPIWQITPEEKNPEALLFDEYSEPFRREAIDRMLITKASTLTDVLYRDMDYHADKSHHEEPTSILYSPIFKDFSKTEIVGYIGIQFAWRVVFMDVLPAHIDGLVLCLESSLGRKFRYRLDGGVAQFMNDASTLDLVGDEKRAHYTYNPPDMEMPIGGGMHGDHHRQLQAESNDTMPTNQTIMDHTGASMNSIDFDETHVGDEMNHTSAEMNHTDTIDHGDGMNHTTGDMNHTGTMEDHHGDGIDHSDGMEHGDAEAHTGNHTGPQEGHMLEVVYTITIFPTTTFEDHYLTNRPAVFCTVVALIFFFTSMTFIVYDCLVENRQALVMKKVVETSQIVHSLFPAMVRDRLLTTTDREHSGHGKTQQKNPSALTGLRETPTVRLKAFLNGKGDKRDDSSSSGSQGIIADLFPETTIMFADIAGFTAWSSEREPSQVFELLEAIYGEFDLEAKRQGVFKIETIGDCYVAATGIPEQRSDHACVMARYAQRILIKFHEIIRELELSLGPGTASLGLRIGMHSGAVTAGVLRGEKSRFQLFGDTMNTASRMESTSKKNMIQASPEASELLKEGGKGYWLVARADIVVAKGKGEIQTCWVRPKLARRRATKRHSFSDASTAASEVSEQDFTELDLMRRLIKWNAAVLENLLINVMKDRSATSQIMALPPKRTAPLLRRQATTSTTPSEEDTMRLSVNPPAVLFRQKSDYVGEASEPVSFAPYSPGNTGRLDGSDHVSSIGKKAKAELLAYVGRIARMYRLIKFHNFEHASHVTMSANKLMKKISETNTTAVGSFSTKKSKKKLMNESEETHIHRFFTTFGICSDPLSHLAVVFAALIHDVDHYGIPNVELINENPELGVKYRNTSVAEQNSIGKAWDLLMGPDFANLRECIFGRGESEKQRFKQLLIRIIIATDIADRERMTKEKKRWNEAFADIADWERQWRGKAASDLETIDVSIKATAVLEQLMLASDVAHTMQHWITFAKWNERLFKERMVAFIDGKSEVDPRVGWYESELGFFDGYIIPLATRLKQCGVFGTAGDEYLGYALKNRQEWTEKGQLIVKGYIRWASELIPENILDNDGGSDEESCFA